MADIDVQTFETSEAACRSLAGEIAELIRASAASARPIVLGLATGSTPIGLYRELVRLHREAGLSFARVVTFNLDEYEGLPPEHPESYWSFMHHHLFQHIDIAAGNIHIPSGTSGDAEAHCDAYEAAIRAAGGIDLQVLGIGRSGHIGFNEPGSPQDSRTRRIELDPITREDAAEAFGGLEKVPTHAITMGCGTILAARRVRLLAFGDRKAGIVRKALHGPVTTKISASFLQDHPDAAFMLDRAAAAELHDTQTRKS
jgi:glucosamine-6-phosphate deaminase